MVSTSVPHEHIGFTVSLKPCLTLWSLKWVNCIFNRDNNFTPIGSGILQKKFSSFSVIINFFILYVDFAFLFSGLGSFHSSMQYGKNVLLKLFLFNGKHFNLPDNTDLNEFLF